MSTKDLKRLAVVNRDFILEVAKEKSGVSEPDELFGEVKPAPIRMEIPPSWLIVPDQTRKKYAVKPLAELADSMEELTQIHPASAGLFTDIDYLKRFVTELNTRFDQDYRIGEAPFLPVSHEEYGEIYMVAIAGNRRTLANLANNAALSLLEGNEVDFDRSSIEVRAWLNPDFLLAMKLQVAENAGREDVLPWDEAETVHYVYKNDNHGQSKKAFAREYGMSQVAFQNHLRYMELPRQIRQFVDGTHPWLENEARLRKVEPFPQLPYDIAVKMWPLLKSPYFTEDDLVVMATDFIRKRASKKEMEAVIAETFSYRRLPLTIQTKLISEGVPSTYWIDISKYFIEIGDEVALEVLVNECVADKWTLAHLQKKVSAKINEKKTYNGNGQSSFTEMSAEFAVGNSTSKNRAAVEVTNIRKVAEGLLRLVTLIKSGGPSAAAVIEGIGSNATELETVVNSLNSLGQLALDSAEITQTQGLAFGISELLAFVNMQRESALAATEARIKKEIPQCAMEPSFFA